MLHFQHQAAAAQHPYATLHHLNQQQQQQPQAQPAAGHHGQQHPAASQTLHFGAGQHQQAIANYHPATATATSQQSLFHTHANVPLSHQQQLLHQQQLHQHQQHQQQQHQQQQQQHQHQQQQQQQQYNMNSDYSSSTYHIYDQISDLIIIKQQRMERKRQLEHRRKVILLFLVAILLVGSLLFLLLQSLWTAAAANNNQLSTSSQSQIVRESGSHATNNLVPVPPWAPSGATQTSDWFDGSQLHQPTIGSNPSNSKQQLFNAPTGKQVIQIPASFDQPASRCSGHGLVVVSQEAGIPMCKCDLGYWGDRCQESYAHPRPAVGSQSVGSNQAHIATCLINNCSNNGHCNSLGQCQCFPGFLGQQCEIQLQPLPPTVASAPPATTSEVLAPALVAVDRVQPPEGPKEVPRKPRVHGCPSNCSGRGQCVRVSDNWEQPANNLQASLPAEWQCQCQPGSVGDDCGQLIERQCDDGIDNDGDGLIDCADSECCGDKVCQNSTLCMKSPDPLDILMRKQPPPPTSSFFQRMQFLIEKFSSQIYSNPKDFNDSFLASKHVDRASVIRGRVTYMKQGVTGVRVSVAGQISLGITLSRDGGYFDLMVNGGGAVVIEFRREPFATKQKTVRVPWNEIVLVDQVELQLESQTDESQLSRAGRLAESDSPICSAHNYKLMRPQIVASPKSTRKSQSSSRSSASGVKPASQSTPPSPRAVLLRDSAIVQQSIPLPSSSNRDAASSSSANQQDQSPVSLVYISSRANEFMSTISIQLTPQATTTDKHPFYLPDELKSIHLKIIIEGNLFEQTFVPQTNLSFTYAWNRRNVYRQKSFGVSTASVSVGYEYSDCAHIIWSTKQIRLPGHDLSISDIGNQWNLNIHHRYNYRDSILQRGDGQNFYLKTDKPKVVQIMMGDGYQRQPICPYCDGATSPAEQRLLKPQALVSSHDGSLYVGDFNLIRRIESAASGSSQSDRVVRTVLELPTNRVPSKYQLALNLVDQRLFMTDIDRHQVFLIKETSKQQSASSSTALSDSSGATTMITTNETLSSGSNNGEENLVPVVGNGDKCQPNDNSNCGDGLQARLARLIEPKSIAFDIQGRMYIADGPNVRMVDVDQKIYTILGNYNGAARHTKFPCSGEAIPMHKFVTRAPLDLAISPIDDTLHILDENVVYKITQDKRVQIVAGKLAHCFNSQTQNEQPVPRTKLRATEVFLQSAQSIVFNQNGDLFISEDDQSQMISRVLMVSPEDDSIALYAGLQVEPAAANSVQPQAATPSANSLPRQTSPSFLLPTVDSIHLDEDLQQPDKQRSSNVLPLNQLTRASDYKFNSVAAIAVDQLGNLIVADKIQLRVLSIEPDLPQINSAGEYELQSPDNGDELLVFNRHGHHVATREISSDRNQRQASKYTFSYNVNTSFGQLASVAYSSGNKLSIYRDGPHHTVKMIETAFGGQCKLDISRSGQVHSISTVGPNETKTSLAYQIDGGLLKQSRDQASGETYEFSYDEFGRATLISHSSPKLKMPLVCPIHQVAGLLTRLSPSNSNTANCASLVVAE